MNYCDAVRSTIFDNKISRAADEWRAHSPLKGAEGDVWSAMSKDEGHKIPYVSR